MLSCNHVRSLFSYDATSGELRWKVSGKGITNGSLAGRLRHGKSKYSTVKIDQKQYATHRVIWLYMMGAWPKNEIDHINHDTFDNRWANLRDATRSQNNANRRSSERGLYSALKGVSYLKKTGRFTAGIKVHGRSIHLGCFKTDIDAHAAYCAAAGRYFGEFAHDGA